MKQLTAFILAFAMLAVGALAVVGAPSQSNTAHATSQVALTASYSIIGGSGTGVQDLLTYVNNGLQVIVPLTTTPTAYMVDSGTPWSVQTTLNGSSPQERWITPSGDISGTISSPLTVSYIYYHQYLVNFNYNVTNGASGSSGPSVSYNELGSPVSSIAPGPVWVDASSSYSYSSQLPGSTPTERWIPQSGGSGTITAAGKITVTYYHEYLVSSSFSIIGGGAPTPPTLTSTAFGAPASVDMTSFTQNTWFDAGASYTFTAPLATSGSSSANETWIGTVRLQTQSGNVLSMDNNGTVTGPLSITPVYYHQFQVDVGFNYVGGSTSGLTLPTFTYQHFGNKTSVDTNSSVWVDSGTGYTLPEAFCCGDLSTERWELYNSTSGTITSSTTIDSTYIQQYFDSFSYSIVGQQPSSPSGQPGLTYYAGGNAQQLTLLETPQSFWADAGSAYSASATLSTSTASERWFSTSATGSILETQPTSVDIAYTQQYLLTIVGGGLPTEWVDAGANSTLTMPGVYGRSEGAGYRVISYEIDQGSPILVSQPSLSISVQLSMTGPHTMTFQSVNQFEVSLDAGASGAVASITSPTIAGDSYWYDSGSAVQVVLNGAWGRANGVGHRITSISVTAQPSLQVDTIGTVQAYSTQSILTPVSITTTSVAQYEVVLNSAGLAAFSSISPPSTFTGDTYWYDSGSPAVTVVLDGTYSRSGGTGFRTSSWELGTGAVTKVATTGTISIVTKAMTAPQVITVTSVTQYQVTLDKAGTSALSSITAPSIPLDSGWYDASSPVGVVMDGVWARASGTGQRLAGYSLNGGTEVTVASSGLVNVLNLPGISSPEAITTTVVTQYQVSLDPGAVAALSSMTPTSIPQDKYWYDSGTPVTVSLNGVWGRTSGSGSRLLSFSVNLGPSTTVLSASPVTVLSLSGITSAQSITTKTNSQFHLTSSPVTWVSVTNSTIPGDAPGWFDIGTAVKAVYNDVWNATSGSRESVTSYSVDTGGKTSVSRSGTGTFTVALPMTAAHSIAIVSVTQYALTFLGPAQITATPPSQTGDLYFDAGSKATFTVPRVWNATSGPGTRDMLTSYSLDGASAVAVPPSSTSSTFTTQTVTFTQPQTLTFNAVVQYQVAFQFFDGLGRNPVQPSLVQIGVGNSTIDVPGTSVWLANGTSFSVVNVTWEGADVGPTTSPSYVVKAAPLNVTLDTSVYPASLKVVDLFGLPVSGAQVSMTLANGTVVTGTTKSDGVFAVGMIPLGTFTAKVSSLGGSSKVVGDSASGQQVAEGRLPFSTISLIVIVAVVAGVAGGGVFMLRKVRRGKGTKQVSEQK